MSRGMRARVRRTGAVLSERVLRAESLAERLKGLLGRAALGPGESLWLEPCAQVHTCFMGFPIDVVFLDRERKVVRICRDLVPWRLSPWVWRARSVLELASGAVGDRLAEGDVLEFEADARRE